MKTSRNMFEAVVGPQFDQYLLAELKEAFPPKSYGPENKIEEIMYHSGQRAVVEWLINRLEDERN